VRTHNSVFSANRSVRAFMTNRSVSVGVSRSVIEIGGRRSQSAVPVLRDGRELNTQVPPVQLAAMMALIDVVSRLVGDVGRFVDLFLNDLILGAGDPISALLVVVGQILLGGAMAAFGYAVVGVPSYRRSA